MEFTLECADARQILCLVEPHPSDEYLRVVRVTWPDEMYPESAIVGAWESDEAAQDEAIRAHVPDLIHNIRALQGLELITGAEEPGPEEPIEG